MANTRSAEKQNRQAQKHRIRNAHVLSTLRTSVRKFREAAASGDPAILAAVLASNGLGAPSGATLVFDSIANSGIGSYLS